MTFFLYIVHTTAGVVWVFGLHEVLLHDRAAHRLQLAFCARVFTGNTTVLYGNAHAPRIRVINTTKTAAWKHTVSAPGVSTLFIKNKPRLCAAGSPLFVTLGNDALRHVKSNVQTRFCLSSERVRDVLTRDPRAKSGHESHVKWHCQRFI